MTSSPTILKQSIAELLAICDKLNKAYPERSFAFDSVLLGDIGKTLAEAGNFLKILSLKQKQHNAVSTHPDNHGPKLELRVTMQDNILYIGVTKDRLPNYYLGLKINHKGDIEEIYNGPGALIDQHFDFKNKQIKTTSRTLDIKRLKQLNKGPRTNLKIQKRSNVRKRPYRPEQRLKMSAMILRRDDKLLLNRLQPAKFRYLKGIRSSAEKGDETKIINSVSDLIEKVLNKQTKSNDTSVQQKESNDDSSQQAENYVFCYRGQADFDWEPEPSLNRYENGADVECKSLTELINEIPDEFQKDVTCFQRLMRSQHYGLPTRLLDVTTNPLVALFFACNNEEEQCKDGAFFTFKFKEKEILNPDSDKLSIICNLSQLSESEKTCLKSLIDNYKTTKNKQTFKVYLKSSSLKVKETESYGKLLSFIQKEKPYFVNKIEPDCLENYYFVNSLNSNKRIIAQSGAFIVSGFMDYNFQDNTEFKTKFKIPKEHKKAIIEELRKFNITEKSLFPDIEHIAAYLKHKYQKKK